MDVALKLKHEALDDPEFTWQREQIIERVETHDALIRAGCKPSPVPLIFR